MVPPGTIDPTVVLSCRSFSGSTQKHVTRNEDPIYGIWIPTLSPVGVAFYCIEAILLCARAIIHRGNTAVFRAEKKNAIDGEIPTLGRLHDDSWWFQAFSAACDPEESL